jgi:3-oxoacyl-[acyl-carrier protein] reductase
VLLEDRNAVIYGGGGSIGGAVARAFAREGAKVFLAGRTRASLEEVAKEIRSAGGVAETADVDALDENAVDEHADAVAAEAGGIDISFNLISHGDVQGTPLAEMSLEDFERPVVTAVRTTFLTSRAAARHMIRQRSGVILVFGGSGDPMRDYYLGGLQVAFEAMESMRRQLAIVVSTRLNVAPLALTEPGQLRPRHAPGCWSARGRRAARAGPGAATCRARDPPAAGSDRSRSWAAP